ncbi:MAG: GNAT family N-acetyltransferase [Candidatus Glassbacteria bacterium]
MQLEQLKLADLDPDLWNGFLDRAGADSPFCRHAWLDLIDRANPAWRVSIIALLDKGSLAAALPVVDHGFTLFSQSHSLPQGSPAGPLAAAGENAAQAMEQLLARWVATRTCGWAYRLALTFDNPDPLCLDFLRRHKFTLIEQQAYRIRTGEGNFAEWEQSLAGDVRKKMRQADQRGASFEEASAAGRAEELVRLARLTASRHRRRPPYGETFYRLLLGEQAPPAVRTGLVRLFVVRVEGRPAAFNLCLTHAGRWWLVDHGADRSLADRRPADLLYREIVRTAFAESAAEIDLGAVPPGADSLARFKSSLAGEPCRRLSAVKRSFMFAATELGRRVLP